jgi:hypothetical protein
MNYYLTDLNDTKLEITHDDKQNLIQLSIVDYDTGITTCYYLTKKQAFQLKGVLHHIEKDMK